MNWIQRKIHLYNVTFGLYMLDWWERYLFNILVVVLMWFIFYNGSKYVTDFFQRTGGLTTVLCNCYAFNSDLSYYRLEDPNSYPSLLV
ncbi:hypothetical protein CUMW_050200 [Citrus unshiu]|nr:hypothetical protein CUMW_050200 [Citrus unshiu]